MKIYQNPDDLDVRVEIIPLIDVIFCILIFFILAAVSLTRLEGLNIDLPQAETAKAQFGDTLPVEIDALGQIKVQQTTINEAQLAQLLANYVKERPSGIVVLQADQLVSYGQVARIIDILQQAGGERIALGADQEPVAPSGLIPGQQVPPATPPNQGIQPDTPSLNIQPPNLPEDLAPQGTDTPQDAPN